MGLLEVNRSPGGAAGSGAGASKSAPGFRIHSFEKVAYMRSEYLHPHPQIVSPGNPEQSLLLFVNLTNATQDIYIGAAAYSVPRWKSRAVEASPRMTDIWLKGGERNSFPLEAGVVHRLEIRGSGGASAGTSAAAHPAVPADKPSVPPERLLNITVINRSPESINLLVNGYRDSPVHIAKGAAHTFPVPGGEIVLSCHADDAPDACYLVAKPQPGFAFDMF